MTDVNNTNCAHSRKNIGNNKLEMFYKYYFWALIDYTFM